MNALALSVSHTLDSSPKVGALGKTGNFAVLPKAPSPRELAANKVRRLREFPVKRRTS